MGKPLMQMLLEAGYPKDQVFHHESDLYVYRNDLTTKVIDEWLAENGWSGAKNDSFFIDRFIDQITGKPMYDIAFQYIPYWEGVGTHVHE